MKRIGFMSLAVLSMSSVMRDLSALSLVPAINVPGSKGSGKAFDWRYGGGRVYPHSSDRQRARYARQIAAGQLSMAGIKGRANG